MHIIRAPTTESILKMGPFGKSRRWFLTAFLPAVVRADRLRAEVISMPDLKRAIEGGASRLTFRLGPTEWEFLRISPGAFLMGSAADDPDANDDEKPARLVRITRPFYLSKYQVTQLQYSSIMVHSHHRNIFQGDDLPVNNVKYPEALEFCRQMSSVVGITVTLPTEAQWEYACRAGTTTIYYSGSSLADLDRIAWFRDNSDGRMHAVGMKQPNAWGLYDMEGNACEPCLDYITSSKFPTDDPVGSRSTDSGIARGGMCGFAARDCRVTSRILTNDIFGGVGLRVAINPPIQR